MKKILYIGIIITALLPGIALAQTTNTTAVPAGQSEFSATPATPPNYTLLAPLPCVGTTAGTSCTSTNGGASLITSIGIQGYLLYLFKLAIAVAVFLAVIMTIFGGFKYMTVESVTGKGDARKTIENAALGLLLALSSYLILYTVNPDLVNLTKVALPKLNVSASSNVQAGLAGLQTADTAMEAANNTASNAALNANAQSKANVQTDQTNVNQLQSELQDCDLGTNDTYCDSSTYTSLQNQLTVAQNQLTTDTNNSTVQTAVSEIDKQAAQGAGTSQQQSLAGSDAANSVQTQIDAINADAAAATSSLTNDPAAAQQVTDTATVKDYELLDEQFVLQISGELASNRHEDAQDDLLTITEQGDTVASMNDPAAQQDFTNYVAQIKTSLSSY